MIGMIDEVDNYWSFYEWRFFLCILSILNIAFHGLIFFSKDGESDKSREIKQYQYTAWPDHGVPHYCTSLLCFIRKVRAANPSDAGPVIVHCR